MPPTRPLTCRKKPYAVSPSQRVGEFDGFVFRIDEIDQDFLGTIAVLSEVRHGDRFRDSVQDALTHPQGDLLFGPGLNGPWVVCDPTLAVFGLSDPSGVTNDCW